MWVKFFEKDIFHLEAKLQLITTKPKMYTQTPET